MSNIIGLCDKIHFVYKFQFEKITQGEEKFSNTRFFKKPTTES